MTVIGGPLWFYFWRAVQRRVKSNQEEIGAALRKFFLNFILLVSALTAVIAASDFLRWLLAGVPLADFSSGGLATMIVAGIVWFYHCGYQKVKDILHRLLKTLRRWYVYILAGFGLVWLAVRFGATDQCCCCQLANLGRFTCAGQFWNNTTQLSIAWILLGGLTWYFHWFRMAKVILIRYYGRYTFI